VQILTIQDKKCFERTRTTAIEEVHETGSPKDWEKEKDMREEI
jgi:hypothetical protein